MNKQKLHPVLLLIGCLLLPLIIGAIGGFFTASSVTTWYLTLNKPWFTPPNWVFGPAWTILYLLMGASFWFIIKKGISEPQVRIASGIFLAQLFINLCWSLVFFGMQSPLGALIMIIVLLLLIGATIRAFFPLSRTAAYLLIPYLCWTCFATGLNVMIVLLN